MDGDESKKASDPYGLGGFSSASYPWDERGRSLARAWLRGRWALYAGLLALLALALWWLWPYVGCLGLGASIGALAAILILYLGCQLQLSRGLGRRIAREEPDAAHDALLQLYHHRGPTDARSKARMLVLLARADIARGEDGLAALALDKVQPSRLDAGWLKLFYLLRLASACLEDARAGRNAANGHATAVGMDDRHREEPGLWLARYTGIPARQDQRFPSDEEARSWVEGAATADQVRAGAASASLGSARILRAPALCSLMLAHCVSFLSLWLGTGNPEGGSSLDPPPVSLRVAYAGIAAPLCAFFLLALTAITLRALWRRGNAGRGPRMGAPRIAAIAARVLVVLAMLAVAAAVAIVPSNEYDGSERVIATGMSDGPDSAIDTDAGRAGGRTYDYLAVEWRDSDGGEATGYYRACDPILMEPWSSASAYDDEAQPSREGDASESGDPTADGAIDDGSEAGDGRLGGDSAAASTDAGQTDGGQDAAAPGATDDAAAMEAAFGYLEAEGSLPNMALSWGADAKGDAYAVVAANEEAAGDGSPEQVEWRLYGNGEKPGDDGAARVELVLEKCWPDGSRDAELAGFYLVDPATLEVTDEHRTSW